MSIFCKHVSLDKQYYKSALKDFKSKYIIQDEKIRCEDLGIGKGNTWCGSPDGRCRGFNIGDAPMVLVKGNDDSDSSSSQERMGLLHHVKQKNPSDPSVKGI